jgi:hypothetical protein
MIENIECYGILPDSVLEEYCHLPGAKECQQLTQQCKSGDFFAFVSCLAIPIPCTIAAVQIAAPALSELINSSVKCY